MYIFNSRKKLVLKSVIFICLVIAALSILNSYYITKNVCDNDRTAKFRRMEPGILISNTGSSHGLYGFNYGDLESQYQCFNFALESQSLSYDYRVVSEYIDYLAEDGVMFVTVSFFSLYGMDELEQEGFEGKNYRYYKILSPKRIKEYCWKDDLKYHFFPVTNDEDVLKTLVEGKQTGEAWQRVWYLNAAESENLEGDAQSAYERHYVKNANMIDNREINKEEYEALLDIISLCKSKNIRTVLITIPVTTEYKRKISNDFLNDFYDDIEKITVETGVEYYDYSSDERIVSRLSLFMNADHLNHEGALEFTRILKEEIIDEKYGRKG